MKSECITMRSKLKEVENDYHTLQTKHRYGKFCQHRGYHLQFTRANG